MSNIKSITPIGKHQTYDLEVDHRDHQFYLANGVLTSNSHAVAYAIDSFWCAWLLTYYEEQWLSAYLESMSNSPLKRAKAFGEVRALGYQIVPIDINHAGIGWTVLPGKKLMPSMTSLKGVGDAAVEELMQLRPIESIEQLLYNEDGSWRLSKFNKKALEALIKVKAFESVNCVGPDKIFKSYKHMYWTLMGEYSEEVTRTRKGVTETVEVVRDHATLIKRSTAKDPLEGKKNFYELARKYAEGATEWTHLEFAEFQVQYFGSSDVTTMFDNSLFQKLDEKGIKPIEELEIGQTDLVWFVTAMLASKKGGEPSAGLLKKTKTGKTYVQIFATGPSGKPSRLNIWGSAELLEPYKLCVAEVKRDDFGLSTTKWKLKVMA